MRGLIKTALLVSLFVCCGDGRPTGGSTNAEGDPWICKMDLFENEIDSLNVCECIFTAPDPSYNVVSTCDAALFDGKADCVKWNDPEECFCRRYMCGQFGDECVCGGYFENYTQSCNGDLCCANFDDGTCYCNPANTSECDSSLGYVNVVSCDAEYVLPRLQPTTFSGGTRVNSCSDN